MSEHQDPPAEDVDPIPANENPLPTDPNGNPLPMDPAVLRRQAQLAVSTPAIGVILCGVISIFIAISGSIMFTKNPDGVSRLTQSMGFKKPVKLDEEQVAEKREENRQRTVDGPVVWRLSIMLLGSFLTIVGGLCMKRLKYRKFAIFTSVLAMIPCCMPCCIGMVFGAWSIVAMMREDVVTVFETG